MWDGGGSKRGLAPFLLCLALLSEVLVAHHEKWGDGEPIGEFLPGVSPPLSPADRPTRSRSGPTLLSFCR